MTVQEPQSQLDKFKQAARELETDDDPKRFAERLGKLVKHKPVTPTDEKPSVNSVWDAVEKTDDGAISAIS